MDTYVGSSVLRSEDPRLLTGNGRYIDDIVLPDMVHAAFVRSEHAHARINGIDTSRPIDARGARRDDARRPGRALQHETDRAAISVPGVQTGHHGAIPLARDEVCFVGEPIAVVIADSRYTAEDAAAMVRVDYEPLPAMVDCAEALDADAPLAHAASPDNLVATLAIGFGDVDDAFANAPMCFRDLSQHRGGCHAMECRGVIASRRPAPRRPHDVLVDPVAVSRSGIGGPIPGEDEHNLRVIAPDVGGGFGPKAGVYPEEIVLPLAARMLGRPVKWVEDRREHFIATNQQGDQTWSLEVAADDDGTIRGVRGRVIADAGAYTNYGLILPITTVFPMPGPYAIPRIDVKVDAVFTNTPTKVPVRGAGRPNAAYAMERMIEVIARNLDLDPADVRARNFVRADQFPYQPGHKTATGATVTYDSGDFHGCLDMVKGGRRLCELRGRQAAARAEGRYLGIGVSSYIEDTGMGPYEGATVRVEPSGAVQIQAGTASQGQGHATVFAQIVPTSSASTSTM